MTVTLGPAQIARDQWGRPLIKPAKGGKAVGYTRCTTYVGTLEDTYNLTAWKARQTIIGVVDRPDLLLAAAAHRDDSKRLNAVVEDALKASGSDSAATKGTALHAFTEKADRGEELKGLPPEYVADIEAYKAATEDFEPVLIEQFVVLDDIKVAGTADRVYRYTGEPRLGLEPGRHYIGDVKTGKVDWGFSKIEMQLAVYAHGEMYDIEAAERIGPLPDVSTDIGIVVHLPAGAGEATVYAIPLTEAWDKAVALAGMVRKWRQRKRQWNEFAAVVPAGTVEMTKEQHGLAYLIGEAATPEAVRKLWADNVNEWTDELTAAAKSRVQALTTK